MKRSVFLVLALLLAGCGGLNSGRDGTSERLVVFEPTDPGVVSLVAVPTVPAGTNASAATLDLSGRRSFTGSASAGTDGYGIDAILQTKDGRTLTLHATGKGPFVPGATIALGTGSSYPPALIYEEGGLDAGYYRRWTVAEGTLTVDSLDAGGATAHLAGARMVASTQGLNLDFDRIDSTSTGEFTLDAQIRVLNNRGSVAFTDAAGAELKLDGFAAPEASLTASTLAAGRIEFGFFVPNPGESDEDETGGSLYVDLDPRGGPVAAGRTFALGRDGSSAGYTGFYPHDQGLGRFWHAASGTATIRELHGHVATVELADVRMRAAGHGATGTFTMGGTVVVEFP